MKAAFQQDSGPSLTVDGGPGFSYWILDNILQIIVEIEMCVSKHTWNDRPTITL